MYASHTVERTRTTYYLHVSAGGRRKRIYRSRPSRQVQLRAALADSGWVA